MNPSSMKQTNSHVVMEHLAAGPSTAANISMAVAADIDIDPSEIKKEVSRVLRLGTKHGFLKKEGFTYEIATTTDKKQGQKRKQSPEHKNENADEPKKKRARKSKPKRKAAARRKSPAKRQMKKKVKKSK